MFSPEHLISNMWLLRHDEFITGEDGITINGPVEFKVQEVEVDGRVISLCKFDLPKQGEYTVDVIGEEGSEKFLAAFSKIDEIRNNR